ncbi:prepilin-type N-terminal cleavage/methylation domain-containing protein [Campylobacter sp. faydin G-24]|uniref:Prepilin-type N-terminal cleavage/methylation domain-containing protein n=1 Tax=Campylobacter anatolicus TaxID=2829105 RepID=A0ABS5HHG9_9BACT|nr:prepilin-type N-terminal cleavage/methylation domain-containing protein [Campylobacter anatolicus]MBR8462154.1 prepilin-type N-terminal cleavage/methylation domain-containing protein [Campylobacter anatolicus]MBR8463729.1 prepilin-type N-terminal cleavage/methylation domain-containing protein [Campylobacter anatolicus]
MQRAFSMLELIFVIIILSILVSIAMPKLLVTRDDATLTSAKTTITAIQSAITTAYNENLLKGSPHYPTKLENDGELLFSAILNVGVKDSGMGKSGWHKTAQNSYTLIIAKQSANFTYSPTNGVFECSSGALCERLR